MTDWRALNAQAIDAPAELIAPHTGATAVVRLDPAG
jgi:hypothetical protein